MRIKILLNPLDKVLPIFLLSVLFVSSPLSADEVRYYDFEIIVFESNDPAARHSEVWKNAVTIEIPEKFVQLNRPYPGPMPRQYSPKLTFKRLPKSSYRLTQEAKLLTANNQNKILLHTSWRQPGMPAETALPIHFKREFINTTASPAQPISPDAFSSNAPRPHPADEVEVQQSKAILDGYIKIILSRYLHADVNLIYTTGIPISSTTVLAPTNQRNEDEQDIKAVPRPVIYQLKQTRKMRSKEVHYLDHPVLGMLILATPYLGKTLKAR